MPTEPTIPPPVPPQPPELVDPYDVIDKKSGPTTAPVGVTAPPVEEKKTTKPALSSRVVEFFQNLRNSVGPFFSGKRKILIIGGGIIILLGIGLALWARFSSPGEDGLTPLDSMLNQQQPVNTESTDAPVNESDAPTNDQDGDGLLDSEEATLGTDENDADTDDDILSDRQEVRIYQTNPLNIDSDGDGFTDGEEVRGFYNPNGPGKMVEVPDAIQEYETQQ